MKRILLGLITWGTIALAVVCALLLAAAADRLEPSLRPAPALGRVAPEALPAPRLVVDPPTPPMREAAWAPVAPESAPVQLAERR